MRTPVLAAIVLATLAASPAAEALNLPVSEAADLHFSSGAEFLGTITFTADFTTVLDVSGKLNGYNFGSPAYVGSGFDPINTVLDPLSIDPSLVSAPGTATWFLADADLADLTNLIEFSYSYSPSGVTLLAGDVGVLTDANSVDFSDAMTSGTVGTVGTSVPEPATLSLLGLGLLGLGAARRRRRTA